MIIRRNTMDYSKEIFEMLDVKPNQYFKLLHEETEEILDYAFSLTLA